MNQTAFSFSDLQCSSLPGSYSNAWDILSHERSFTEYYRLRIHSITSIGINKHWFVCSLYARCIFIYYFARKMLNIGLTNIYNALIQLTESVLVVHGGIARFAEVVHTIDWKLKNVIIHGTVVFRRTPYTMTTVNYCIPPCIIIKWWVKKRSWTSGISGSFH